MSTETEQIFEYETEFSSSISAKLYRTREMADFHFIIESDDGNCERISADKIFLAGSDVFQTMFNGTWQEVNEATITGTTAAAFKEFLQFFYLPRVKLTKENVSDVMTLGDKYNVIECVSACEELMMNTMTDANDCVAYYECADLFHLDDLKKYCEAIVGQNAKEVLKSDSFRQCDRDTLGRILKMDTLHCSEVELFEACMAWTKSASHQVQLTEEIVKKHLGKILYDIRFGLISLQEFSDIYSTYNIFSLDEHREIIRMMASAEYVPKIFSENRKKRSQPFEFGQGGEIMCDRTISEFYSSEPHMIKNIETTSFTTNKPLILTGLYRDFQIYNNERYIGCEDNTPTQITMIEIPFTVQPSEEVILYNANHSLDERYIEFLDPIIIKPGFTYRITSKQTPSEGCCSGYLLKSEVKLESDIIIKFNGDSILEDDENVARGPFSGMFFKR